jgi:hypothetical protein
MATLTFENASGRLSNLVDFNQWWNPESRQALFVGSFSLDNADLLLPFVLSFRVVKTPKTGNPQSLVNLK